MLNRQAFGACFRQIINTVGGGEEKRKGERNNTDKCIRQFIRTVVIFSVWREICTCILRN